MPVRDTYLARQVLLLHAAVNVCPIALLRKQPISQRYFRSTAHECARWAVQGSGF